MSNTNTDILLAGAFAAFSIDLLVYPLDTLKTRLQSPDYRRLYVNGASNTVKKGILFRGLYQGVGSVIIATLPSSGAFFTTYEAVKAFGTRHNPTLAGHGSPLFPQPLVHSAASSVAELVSCFILTPAEVLKQNAQMVRQTGSSSIKDNATIQTLRRFNRPSQLWRGYTALAARNLPFTAIQFPIFEHFKASLKSYRQKKLGTETYKPSLLETGTITALSAGTAGAFSAVLTTPIDVIKTRIMLNAANDPASTPEAVAKIKDNFSKSSSPPEEVRGKAKSTLSIGRDILRQEGFKGLWRGGALRGIWTAIGSGLYLGVYESGRVYLESRR